MTSKRPRSWTRPVLAAAAVGAAITVPLLTFGSTTAQASDGRLQHFHTCDDFAQLARQRALDMLAANGGNFVMPMARAGIEDTTGGTKQLHATVPAAATTPTHSTTNVQVAGIDEPDVVKSDGRRTFAIAGGKIHAIDTSGPRATLMGSVALPNNLMAQEMLLVGNRLLVVGGSPIMIEPGIGGPATVMGRMANMGTTFVDVDVSDIAHPKIRETLTVDAAYASARLTGTTARIVLTSDPLSAIGMSATNEDEYRKAIQSAGAQDFIPHSTFTDAAGTPTDGPLVSCSSISHPAEPSDMGMISLVTMDLSSGIRPVDADAVMAQGSTIMASANRIYVAVSRSDLEDTMMVAKTDVHVFDTSQPDQTDYLASGTVLGNLLNQFALDEYDGRLRVATTLQSYSAVPMVAEPTPGTGSSPGAAPSDPAGAVPGEPGASSDPSVGTGTAPTTTSDSDATATTDAAPAPGGLVDTTTGTSVPVTPSPVPESAVTVLQLDGEHLRQVGRVAGLGKGEQIYAVRFIGPTGYVVTFRQTDPLYTIDLSNPVAPRVVGELKIPGYSSYLYPVDDHTLIGIGQNVGSSGTIGKDTQSNGLQVGLFDVSDPAAPKRTQVWTLPGSYSDAEYDAHAFLWWPATKTVVVPVGGMVMAAPGSAEPLYRPAAVALRVDSSGITRTGTIIHPKSDQTSVRRSAVIGENLYTFSDAGFRVSTLDGSRMRQWVAFK